ncbi:diaminopimelate epimerase [Bacillus sp. FJAT-27225]|uniref:diaminopimelate epimerase n=1 Tax=Bacillus sp. FJAT-27225 TaxID=1743144 RepID=UPI00080C2799|nr:diaminopimelate epimerase [Bacillus sp. FJAT-27225]OCA90811.1 diaminopimelate epimerase [Bacillus sp. FJAT-27225]
MKVDFIKVHGSGNDFLLIDEFSSGELFTYEERGRLARLLCDRENGPGADGILYIQKSETADAAMRVFNADGSEASMCGNGLRCAGRFICELLGKETAIVETMKVNLLVQKYPDIYEGVSTFNVEISLVLFALEDLPLNLDKETLVKGRIPELSRFLEFTAVAMPNPHLVSIVGQAELAGSLQRSISEKVNGPNELFPDGVNVSFVRNLAEGHIFVRTFERGGGFTNACGTAMSASSLVTCLYGYNQTEKPIRVYNDGGMVECIVREHEGMYKIELIGNGTFVYKAKAEFDLASSSVEVTDQVDLGEQDRYSYLQKEARRILSKYS